MEYAMHRVRMLRHYKVEPYIVFDGGPLSAKKGTESERKKKRDAVDERDPEATGEENIKRKRERERERETESGKRERRKEEKRRKGEEKRSSYGECTENSSEGTR